MVVELKPLELDNLRNEIKSQIIRDIQSGVLDKDSIRAGAKNIVKQRLNEQIIGKAIPPERPSVKGFLANAKEDLGEFVSGIGALIGLGAKAVMNPIKTIKTGVTASKKLITSPAYRDEWKAKYINPIVEEYKEYRNPLTKIYEDPLDVFLDVTALFSLGGTALTKAGAKTAGKIATKISTPVSLKNISKGTKFVVKKIPGGKEIINNIELATQTRKILRKEQASFLIARQRQIQEIDKRVRKLTPDEVKALPLTAEGFSRAPANASKEFYEAIGLVRSLAKDQERFGLKIGKLTPEIVERRKWQPLAKWLEKEGKITAKTPYEQLQGNALTARINKIKEFFPEADPIYMRHFFEDDPARFSQFFLNTKPVRTFRPGFLKKSYGKGGYIGAKGAITKAQLRDVLTRQATENIKWQRNISLIENIKKNPNVLPLKVGQDPLPGYKVFAPDGMIKFYQGSIDLSKELRKKIDIKDDVWEVFQDSVKSAFPEKKYVGVSGKVKLFQAPEAMANQLSQLVKSSNPYIKLLWDKPLDAFRFAVLALYPRWNLNNVVGNAMFSIVSGDVFNPKAFYIYRQARKMERETGKAIFPDELFGGVHHVERTTSGKLGAAVDKLPWVKSTIDLHDKLLDTRVIGSFVKAAENTVKVGVYKPIKLVGNIGFKANFMVDDMFKGVGFINRVLREERKGFIRRMTVNFDDSLKALQKVKPPKVGRIIDDVHDWYYHGLNLTDFERRAIRRIIPFYSWMRWVTLYSYRIGTEAPVRANIIKNIARDFYTFTGQNKLPAHLKGAVPVGNDEDGTVYYLRTTGMNPFDTLNDLMSEGVIGVALRGAAPGVKTAIEQATGRETFLGIPFTKKDIHQAINGRLFKFDPELGKVVEVPEKVKPGLIENLLRNYIPQYLLMETMLTGGKQRYTAEGLDTILADLFKDPSERKAVVRDILNFEEKEKTTPLIEAVKALGISIKPVEPKKEKARLEAIQKATTAIKNKEIPLLHPQVKTLLKEKMMQGIISGKSKEEITQDLQEWIGDNLEKLKKLN